MDSAQLTHILKKDQYIKPHFVTVCAHNHLERHILQTFHNGRRHTAAIVFNLDPSHLPGSHWVAVYLDFNGHAEYFDSTGLPPDPACCQLLRRVCPRIPIKKNTVALQDRTQVCGQFCVAFLKLRCRGYSFDDTIHQLNFKDNDRAVYDLVKASIPNLPFTM